MYNIKMITSLELSRLICKDYNLDPYRYEKFTNFSNTKAMKQFVKGSTCRIRVVTSYGNYPYMRDGQRNEAALAQAIMLVKQNFKTLEELADEAGIALGMKIIRVSEPGGWYSHGVRYTYKDKYCEI